MLHLQKDTIADFDGVLRVCRRIAEAARKDPRELWLDFVEEVPDVEGLIVLKVLDFEEDVERARQVRDEVIKPALDSGNMIVLDFTGIQFATQSFAHALMYKLLRDEKLIASLLSIAGCSESTREAILAVAGYATVPENEMPEGMRL